MLCSLANDDNAEDTEHIVEEDAEPVAEEDAEPVAEEDAEPVAEDAEPVKDAEPVAEDTEPVAEEPVAGSRTRSPSPGQGRRVKDAGSRSPGQGRRVKVAGSRTQPRWSLPIQKINLTQVTANDTLAPW